VGSSSKSGRILPISASSARSSLTRARAPARAHSIFAHTHAPSHLGYRFRGILPDERRVIINEYYPVGHAVGFDHVVVLRLLDDALQQPLDDVYHRSRRCSILLGVRPQWFALVLAVVAVIAWCAWAPWVLVDAAFPDNHIALGFAPLWTSKFESLPAARVDVHQLLIQIGFLTVVAALIGLARAIRQP
jgi:hypothetical protein